MTLREEVRKRLFNTSSIAPIITFRILFGVMMMFSIIRFTLLGWIDKQYLEPNFHFKYYGFEWVTIPPSPVLYGIYALMAIGALGILFGWYYRLNAVLFFATFSYVELFDKTFYLNHYYFISVVSFLLIFIPANRRCSMDVSSGRVAYSNSISKHYLLALKIQVAFVYFFAGIAKINYDWLIRAMPMGIWLPANSHQPILGKLFAWRPTAHIFSWIGMFYDTTIVLFLSIRRTRLVAYVAVISFHLMTVWLFPIGVFPIVMIFSALIFFSPKWHQKVVDKIEGIFKIKSFENDFVDTKPKFFSKIVIVSLLLFQLLFPLRYLAYPGDLFWTEEGYLFSWRVMLTEKSGSADFYVTDNRTGKRVHIDNRDYLIPAQEKMMSTKPDFIIQYARYLRKIWEEKGFEDPKVTADIFVSLNGKRSKRFVDPTTDLSVQKDTWKHKEWILPE